MKKPFPAALFVSCLCLGAPIHRQSGTILTVAGAGLEGYSGDCGLASEALLNRPKAAALDASGNLLIVDDSRIRKVSPAGLITTVAGNRIGGYSGDGGPATSALLRPVGIAVDQAGNVFIADGANYRVRKVSPEGAITTVAGNGMPGFSGDGGPATSASLNFVSGVAVDASGNVFIADAANQRVRKVSPAGIISTVAGNGAANFSGDGGPAASASLDNPTRIALDAAGNLYIADAGNMRVRKVPASGIIGTVAGSGYAGYSGDGGSATSASFSPASVALDASGNLFIADSAANVIRMVTPAGIITTVAGDGRAGFSGDDGPASLASLDSPLGVTADASGDLFIADSLNNRIRKVFGPVPSISFNGVVPVYSAANTIQPGEWVSLFGSSLAPATATGNGSFPTSLADIGVTVNGKPAYLWYVSPTQINFQAPDDTATGPVPVTITSPSGASTVTVNLAAFAPSFSLLDAKHVAGIILRSDGTGTYGGGAYDIVGPTGNSLGYPTVAAKAGDTIELFAVGLGPTNPSVPAGHAFSGSAPTTNSVSLTIGGIPVNPTYTGLSSAGLYQINLTLPAGLGTGDVSFAATVGGARTPANVVLSVQ